MVTSRTQEPLGKGVALGGVAWGWGEGWDPEICYIEALC